MPGNKVITCGEFIALLESQRTIFTDQYEPFDKAEEKKLRKAEILYAKVDELLNQHLKKAHSILTEIKEQLGDEVFLLCGLAMPPSTLGYSKLGKFVTATEAWWASVKHPKGLTLMVEKRYGTRVSSDDRRYTCEPAAKRFCLSESRSPVSDIEFEPPPPPASLDRPVYQPQVSRTTHTFGDLLNFLRKYEGDSSMLQIVCPWDGKPLPSITADFGPGLNLKVELSYSMSSAFLLYLDSSKAVAEVA